jgi:hypothetical protein
MTECLACDPRHEGIPCRYRLAMEALYSAHRGLGGAAGATGHQHVGARGPESNRHSVLLLEVFLEGGPSASRTVAAGELLKDAAAAVAGEWATLIAGKAVA